MIHHVGYLYRSCLGGNGLRCVSGCIGVKVEQVDVVVETQCCRDQILRRLRGVLPAFHHLIDQRCKGGYCCGTCRGSKGPLKGKACGYILSAGGEQRSTRLGRVAIFVKCRQFEVALRVCCACGLPIDPIAVFVFVPRIIYAVAVGIGKNGCTRHIAVHHDARNGGGAARSNGTVDIRGGNSRCGYYRNGCAAKGYCS